MVKEVIQNQMKEALTRLDLNVEDVEVIVTPAQNREFGDYSSNLALLLGNRAGVAPRDIAKQLQDLLNADSTMMMLCEEISVAGPGFLNFRLQESSLLTVLSDIQKQGTSFGVNTSLTQEKILVEYTDTNPFKEFHIGHLIGNIIGESLSRLYESSGAEVKRANYQGDVGLQIAKPVWGLREKIRIEDISLESLNALPLSDRIKILGETYALGSAKYDEDESIKNEINTINKCIYDRSDPEINLIYQTGRKWSLEYLETIYKVLGTTFDFYIFESEVAAKGQALVEEHIGDVFEESEGAVIFPGEKYGLHNRVFINQHGLPTYEGKELGNALVKYELFPYDRSFIVSAVEIEEYFKVVLKVLSMIEPELAEKTTHVAHGLLTLTTGKMSSRTGNVLTGESLLSDLQDLSLQRIKEAQPQLAESEQRELAQKIAVAAIKYAILSRGVGKNIVFDPQQSLSFEGDSGPYLQYTVTRAYSVLAKSSTEVPVSIQFKGTLSAIEREILLLLQRFPEVVLDATQTQSPQLLCAFLIELAQTFNSFYASEQILGSNEEIFRLALTQATAQVLTNGLSLLGIPVVERM